MVEQEKTIMWEGKRIRVVDSVYPDDISYVTKTILERDGVRVSYHFAGYNPSKELITFPKKKEGTS